MTSTTPKPKPRPKPSPKPSPRASSQASPRASAGFATRLLAWWDMHGRKDFPWQQPRTPYRVWVSEIMLQQTQVATVMPYFERFVARFPNVRALAAANLDEVLHLWSGLGYYARARNLHRAARLITEQLDGAFPDTEPLLRTLPGVGRSTAAAIVAQAYGVRAPILDANARRVLARQHRVGGRVASAATRKELWRLAEVHTPAQRPAEYTQAIMDLGATVCRRSRPRCDTCPVVASCEAFAANDTERFPEPTKRRNRRLERRRFFVLIDPDGACLVEKRPPWGIWGGLYSPPERPVRETTAGFLAGAGVDPALVANVNAAPVFRHGFSHYDLEVEPVYVRLTRRPIVAREGTSTWIRPGEHGFGLSAVAVKLLLATTVMELSREP